MKELVSYARDYGYLEFAGKVTIFVAVAFAWLIVPAIHSGV